MIAGLEEITDGTIRIDGRVINDVEPKNRDIAMVFQNYALYPHMTIAENMGFSLRLAKKSKDDIAQRVNEAARILGLMDYLERYPKQLSGGQRQRVRSEEHTSELQSLMRNSYAVFCLKKTNT